MAGMTGKQMAALLSGAFETGSPIAAAGKRGKAYSSPEGGFEAAGERVTRTVDALMADLGPSFAWVYSRLVGIALESLAEGYGATASWFKVRNAKVKADARWPEGKDFPEVWAALEQQGCIERSVTGTIHITTLKQSGTVSGGKVAPGAGTADLLCGTAPAAPMAPATAAQAVAASQAAGVTAAERAVSAAPQTSRDAALSFFRALPLDERRALVGLPPATAADHAAEAAEAAQAARQRAEAARQAEAGKLAASLADALAVVEATRAALAALAPPTAAPATAPAKRARKAAATA